MSNVYLNFHFASNSNSQGENIYKNVYNVWKREVFLEENNKLIFVK